MSANLSVPPSGALRILRGQPNPRGAKQAGLFLFSGDATAAPIHTLIPDDDDVSLPGPPTGLAEHNFRLCVVHFNDLHGHLARIHPPQSRPVFSRIASRLHELRRKHDKKEHAAVLVLSAGDELIGSVFDELLGHDEDSYIAHAGYRLYSAAGIDAGVLGNHDLDLGATTLARSIRRDARYPLLSANLISEPLAGLTYPAALLVLKGVRVGIIGLTTPAEMIGRPGEQIEIAHPIETVHNLLPALRPFCDVMIVLSHLGYSLKATSAIVAAAGDVELAQSLSPGSVHLIVGGHSHHALNSQGLSPKNIVNNIPIVQAGELGRFLGEVDITLRPQAAVTNARLTPVEDLPIDEKFERQHVRPLMAQVCDLFGQSLGRCCGHPDLSTDAVRNTFAAGESALANFISDALVQRCRAAGFHVDFAAIDASSIRCGLPDNGSLTFGDWFNIMPFADTLRIHQLSGRQVKLLLEDNARRADRPDQPHTERGFLHFSQEVRYTIDLKSERGQASALLVTIDGLPLDEQLDSHFQIVCTSFVRETALTWETYAGWPAAGPLFDLRNFPYLDTGLFLRAEMIATIREQGGVTRQGGVRQDGRVRFTLSPPRPFDAARLDWRPKIDHPTPVPARVPAP